MKRSMIRRIALPVVVIALAAGVVLAASLSSLLPGSGTIPGWKVVAGSSRGGSDNDTLYGIYDGAVDGLRQKGLKEAYQRQYEKGDARITADVFRFGSWQQAKAYYVEQRNGNSSAGWFKTYSDVKEQGFIAENAGAIVGMLWGKTYTVQIGIAGSGNDARYEVYKFLKNISGRIQNS